MLYAKTLIDKASKVCGSDSALAERMGIERPNLSLMRSGKRAISPATAAELASIAGENATQAVLDAVIESVRGTRREGVIREILGKALALGVAGLLVFSYSDGSMNATEKIAKNVNPLYIVFTWIMSLIVASLGVFLLRKNRALAYGRASHKIAADR